MRWEKGTTIIARPDDPKYEASRQKGFRVRWLAAKDYEIRGGLLVPLRAAQLRDYYPANAKNIPIRLAQIREGDEKALLAFARDYGLLGFTGALPFTVVSTLAKRLLPGDRKSIERLSTNCGLADQNIWKAWIASGGESDPLPWVWAHVRTLKFCTELTAYVDDEDEEGLIAFLRGYQGKNSRSSKELHPVIEVAVQHQVLTYGCGRPSGWTAFEFARYLRRDLINKNISGIHIALEPEDGQETSKFQFRSLIEMAYWHLHNEVAGGTIRRCKRDGCGGIFVQSHGRTDYCPEPKTPKGESLCAVRDRSRRNMSIKRSRDKLRKKQRLKK